MPIYISTSFLHDIMQLARQRLRAECEEAEAKRRAKAAMVHKQWVKQKRVEEATRREEESARLAAEKKAEEEVFYNYHAW